MSWIYLWICHRNLSFLYSWRVNDRSCRILHTIYDTFFQSFQFFPLSLYSQWLLLSIEFNIIILFLFINFIISYFHSLIKAEMANHIRCHAHSLYLDWQYLHTNFSWIVLVSWISYFQRNFTFPINFFIISSIFFRNEKLPIACKSVHVCCIWILGEPQYLSTNFLRCFS